MTTNLRVTRNLRADDLPSVIDELEPTPWILAESRFPLNGKAWRKRREATGPDPKADEREAESDDPRPLP
jgi:hypothetical protein